MTLDAKQRSSIYRGLAPIIGEAEANALLSQFPANDLDVPATKDFVRASIADVRIEIADVRTEIADVRTEIAGLRTEMHESFAALQRELRIHLVATLAFVITFVCALRIF